MFAAWSLIACQENGGKANSWNRALQLSSHWAVSFDAICHGQYCNLKAGSGGEIQLTDAIGQEIKEGRPVNGFRFDGRRFDCGSKTGFLQATISFALARNDLKAELTDCLNETLVTNKAAQ